LNAFRRSADRVQAPPAPVINRAGQRHGRDFGTDSVPLRQAEQSGP
jgi:hypothetical protein